MPSSLDVFGRSLSRDCPTNCQPHFLFVDAALLEGLLKTTNVDDCLATLIQMNHAVDDRVPPAQLSRWLVVKICDALIDLTFTFAKSAWGPCKQTSPKDI